MLPVIIRTTFLPAAENKYRKNGSKKGPVLPGPNVVLGVLLFEVTVQQTLHAAAMAGFVLCHFMHGVMDGIQIQSLCLLHLVQSGSKRDHTGRGRRTDGQTYLHIQLPDGSFHGKQPGACPRRLRR